MESDEIEMAVLGDFPGIELSAIPGKAIETVKRVGQTAVKLGQELATSFDVTKAYTANR